jgi:hypothetical protein
MTYQVPIQVSPDVWMRQLFSARIALDGGVVRRQVKDVERLIGRDAFVREISRRGFHLIENSGQFLIFCNQDPVLVLC